MTDHLSQIDVAGVRRGIQRTVSAIHQIDTESAVIPESGSALWASAWPLGMFAAPIPVAARSVMLRPPIAASLFNCWISPVVACRRVVPATLWMRSLIWMAPPEVTETPVPDSPGSTPMNSTPMGGLPGCCDCKCPGSR